MTTESASGMLRSTCRGRFFVFRMLRARGIHKPHPSRPHPPPRPPGYPAAVIANNPASPTTYRQITTSESMPIPATRRGERNSNPTT